MLLLDITFDKLPENPKDPLVILRNITNTQDELINSANELYDKV